MTVNCQPTRPHVLRPLAFTLIELLVVIAIIVLIAGFTIPALKSLSTSNNINTAGRMVSNLLTIARSEAINRRALVRFEVATSWPADPDGAYRKLTLVQHDVTSGSDTQITKWETLPAGVIFQPTDPAAGGGAGSYFFVLNQTQSPSLKSGAQTIPTTYIEFMPTGALNVTPANSPVRLRMVQGFLPSSATKTVSSTGGNWFETSVDALVGRIAITRP
jgi:prepilin-type N-terminal cleavage/methylation domain-containing protein